MVAVAALSSSHSPQLSHFSNAHRSRFALQGESAFYFYPLQTASVPETQALPFPAATARIPIFIMNIKTHVKSGWTNCQQSSPSPTNNIKSKRRQLLLQGLFAAAITTTSTNSLVLALTDLPQVLEDDFRFYSDDVNKFEILIPRDWQVGTGEGDGIKSLIVFYPQEAATSNVSIVITGLGADFTKLESFGKVDAFAENLVSGMDRSWQRPPGVAAKLVDSKAANGLYYIEYTLQNPGESRRHLFSVLGIANNGWYNRLYTLTGQFVEEEAETYASMIEKVFAACNPCVIAYKIHNTMSVENYCHAL